MSTEENCEDKAIQFDAEFEAANFLEAVSKGNATFEQSSAHESEDDIEIAFDSISGNSVIPTAPERPLAANKIFKMEKPTSISKHDAPIMSMEALTKQIGEIVTQLQTLNKREDEIKESTNDFVERRYLLNQ